MTNTKIETLDKLRSAIRNLEHVPLSDKQSLYISTGFEQVDSVLPGSGLPLGSLIELLSDETSGALSVALQLSRQAIEGKAAWVVVDTVGSFYPLAAAQHGLDVEKLIVVRAPPARAAWAFSQLLRCPAVGASFFCGMGFQPMNAHGQDARATTLDNMTYRRLQLAAERGGGLGFVLRPAAAIRRPCWAAVRLLVARASARTLTVTLLHVRGSNASGSVALDVDS